MELKQRRIVYITFFLAFFVATPLILAFSLGYRAQFQPFLITKVGAVFVKSYPDSASITLNEKKSRRKTPHQLLNVPPGANVLTISKAGYLPWTKQLEIEPGKTTFVEDILLFKEDFEPVTINEGGTVLADNTQNIWYFTAENELQKLNRTTLEITTAVVLPVGSEVKQLSRNEQAIVYTIGDQWYWLQLDTNITRPLSPLVVTEIDDVVFGQSEDQVWLLADSTVYRFNTNQSQAELFARNVFDMYVSGNTLYTISTDWKLQQVQISSQVVHPETLQVSPQTRILEIRNGITLLRQGRDISIVEAEKIVDAFSATHYNWTGNKILLTDDHEIWLYDIAEKKAVLIDRTGATAENAFLHPSGSYYTRLQNNDLEIIEIDDRGNKRHTIFITKLSADSEVIYSAKGDAVITITPDSITHYTLQ